MSLDLIRARLWEAIRPGGTRFERADVEAMLVWIDRLEDDGFGLGTVELSAETLAMRLASSTTCPPSRTRSSRWRACPRT